MPLAESSVRSFRVAIPQDVIDGIISRVRRAHWADRLDGGAWQYGVDWNYMKELADYWVTCFNWRKAEANLNALSQFKSRVDSLTFTSIMCAARALDRFRSYSRMVGLVR
jgi:hypothetical protein